MSAQTTVITPKDQALRPNLAGASEPDIIELRLQGSWIQADLSGIVSNSAPAFPAAGNPFAYVTRDNVPRVVYLGTDNHIHELRLQGSWIQADLSGIVSDAPPAVPAGGDPCAYVTPDEIARVVYLGLFTPQGTSSGGDDGGLDGGSDDGGDDGGDFGGDDGSDSGPGHFRRVVQT